MVAVHPDMHIFHIHECETSLGVCFHKLDQGTGHMKLYLISLRKAEPFGACSGSMACVAYDYSLTMYR